MQRSAKRRRAGLGLLGASVWVVVILLLYTGWTFFPVLLTKGRIERRIELSLHGVAHSATEEGVRHRIVSKGSSASIRLAEEDVLVLREVEHGKRIFHVDVTYPYLVRYLGSDRSVSLHLQLTHVIDVDEVAVAREREYARERAAEEAAERARADAHHRKVEDTIAACEAKWGEGNCFVTEGYGGEPGSIVRMY